ncbi:MAG: BNR-4 repeat-containing protein [Planctomycetales bacterium]
MPGRHLKSWLVLAAAFTASFAGAVGLGSADEALRQSDAFARIIDRSEDPRTSQIVEDGAWCWFADPRAVRHRGERDRTYVTYVSRLGDVMISCFDHETRTIEHAELHHRLNQDDHANGGIVIRPDGRLMLFYSGHSRRPMYFRVSRKAEDISAWEAPRELSADIPGDSGYTYANPVLLPEEKNRLYLFWRGGNRQPSFSRSDDLGETWEPARNFILRNPPASRPYVKVEHDGRKRIHIAFTDGHPRNVVNSVNYMYYEDGAFHKAYGTRIKSIDDGPVRPGEADVVYHATEEKGRSWIWDIALDDRQRPVIVHSVMPEWTDHRYRYVRWDGRQWVDHMLCRAGGHIGLEREMHYSGGIYLDHEDPSVLYCSRQVPNTDTWRIERWQMGDGGISWKTTILTPEPQVKNVRPITVRHHAGGEIQAIWMNGRYTYWTDYDTALHAWPMNDPPVRPPAD